jgi:hypothetical protein
MDGLEGHVLCKIGQTQKDKCWANSLYTWDLNARLLDTESRMVAQWKRKGRWISHFPAVFCAAVVMQVPDLPAQSSPNTVLSPREHEAPPQYSTVCELCIVQAQNRRIDTKVTSLFRHLPGVHSPVEVWLWLSGGKKSHCVFVLFANCCGVSIPTSAVARQPKWCHWAQR